ncbi:hypothetical protein ACO0K2_11765 [Undibacterium sp. MH2W]|uniref:hypothetical protein n=1 Tax=Undibacterium sp. MH2W TaxID=3413044 RepID=UPI003BEF9C07
MKFSSKLIIGLLFVSVICVLTNDNPVKTGLHIVMIGFAAILLRIFWQIYVFLRNLFKPVFNKLAPYSEVLDEKLKPINEHIDLSLRKSGMAGTADFGKNTGSFLRSAIDKVNEKADRYSEEQVAPTPETHVKCPDCRELVFKDANKCQFCGCKLVPQ